MDLGFEIAKSIPNMVGLGLVFSGRILFTLGELLCAQDDSGLENVEILDDEGRLKETSNN